MQFLPKIFRNTAALFSAEVVTKGFNFVINIYLARKIGTEGYGMLGFAAAFVSYFALIINFGFDLWGTREIARDRNSAMIILNEVFGYRIILTFISMLLYLITIYLFDLKNIDSSILICYGITLFTSAISTQWIFQGLESMSVLVTRQVIVGGLTFIALILFVQSFEDLIISALIINVSSLIASLSLLIFVRNKIGKLQIVFDYDWKRIQSRLKEVAPLALSILMISVYYNLDFLFLGLLKDSHTVGIYNAANRLFLLYIIPLGLISQAFYPALSRFNAATIRSEKIVLIFSSTLVITSGIIAIVGLIFNDFIIQIVFGENYFSSKYSLSILTINVILVAVNISMGTTLIAIGKQYGQVISVSLGAIVNTVLNLLLIPRYAEIGAAFATLLAEVAVFSGLIYFFIRLMKVENHEI